MHNSTSSLPFIPFPLGRVAMTRGFVASCDSMEEATQIGTELIQMHASGDFGVLEEDDRLVNLQGLHSAHPDRVFSAYPHKDDVKVYVITESDRSSTTILLASEY
ncbi:TPA: hypothetical protein ACWLUJ_005794 [Pseudomonas aeruginosa]|nr:hypothetical protein [Pseudomonas aeruginosa]